MKKDVISFAVLRSQVLLSAIMPPKALSLSQANASANALSIVVATETPQGFVCFMIAAVGYPNSFTSPIAALASKILLNESSFPLSCFADETPSSVGKGSL